MLTLVAFLALAQTPPHWLFRQPNLTQGESLPAFSAFGASGRGTSGACSTTPPTGSRGEALTFTRAGSAMCSKQGPAVTGIANGDLVLLSADLPRVSQVAGLLMFLRESARTNSLARSEAFDNAAWSAGGSGAAAPVVTANFATSPDGTLTADRVQFDACPSAGNYSAVYQTAVKAAGIGAVSVYCRGTFVAQSFSICAFGGAAANTVCTQVACPASSWSRPVAIGTAAHTGIVIGCDNEGYAGSGNTGSADVLLWGAQVESGAWASSYIPTVSTSVARAAESVLSASVPAIGPNFALGVSTAYVSSSAAAATAAQLGAAAPALASAGRSSDTAASFTVNATTTTPAVAPMGASTLAACLSDSAGIRGAWWGGSPVSAPAASMTGSSTSFSFGALDAYTARVFVDPSPSRCQ